MQAHRHADDAFVFPGAKPGRPLSNMTFLMLLRRMGHGDVTAHGFRASFKTWASERTSTANEIVEAALAHVVGSKVEQAYRRGDMFERRRRLMQQWAIFCNASEQKAQSKRRTPEKPQLRSRPNRLRGQTFPREGPPDEMRDC